MSTRRAWWSWAMPLLTFVGLLAVPALGFYGFQAVLNSTDGTLREVVTDPGLPGYEVVVVPTPTMAVITVDDRGTLTMVAVLSLSAESGGSVMVVPPELQTEAGETLIEVHQRAGAEAVVSAVEDVLGVALADQLQIDPPSLAGLVEPVVPLEVPLNDALLAVDPADPANPTVVFPAGTVTLAGDDLAAFAGWVNPTETPLNRPPRQVAFWRAWLDAVSGDPAGNVAGEADSGIGRFVRSLAGGNVRFSVLPVLPADPATPDRFPPDPEGVADLVAATVPFPQAAPPGSRPRTKVLDGTGRGIDAVSSIAQQLAAAGAEPIVIGNASSFDATRTTIVYHDRRWEADASALLAVLGDAEVRLDPLPESPIDVTVTLGGDVTG